MNSDPFSASIYNKKHLYLKFWKLRSWLSVKIVKLTTSIYFFLHIFSALQLDNGKSTGDTTDCSNTLLRYFWVETNFTWMWPTIIKVGSKWVLGPKIWFSGKFRRLRCSRWQFQEDLKFCTFYPNHNTQYWPIFSFGIDHLPWFLAAWKSRYFSKITVFLFFFFFFFFLFLVSFIFTNQNSERLELIAAVI